MAIEKIGVVRPESRVIEDSLLMGADAFLAFDDLFSLPGTGRWKVVAGEPDVEGVVSFAVSDSGLQVSALGLGTCQVELQGVRNGRSEYVVLHLEVVEDAGVESWMEVSGSFVDAVYPVPAVDYVNVRLSAPVSGLQVVNSVLAVHVLPVVVRAEAAGRYGAHGSAVYGYLRRALLSGRGAYGHCSCASLPRVEA